MKTASRSAYLPYRVVMVGRPHRDPTIWVPDSAHHKLRRAIEACDTWLNACTDLTPEFAWHFQWFVVDERTGEKLYEAMNW